jgi:hypothetical protein
MKHEGQRWTNNAAIDAVEKGLKEGGGHHGEHPAEAPRAEPH